MAQVEIPLLDAQYLQRDGAVVKLREARQAVERLGLLGLAKDLAEVEDRLRTTSFEWEADGFGAKLTASVPD